MFPPGFCFDKWGKKKIRGKRGRRRAWPGHLSGMFQVTTGILRTGRTGRKVLVVTCPAGANQSTRRQQSTVYLSRNIFLLKIMIIFLTKAFIPGWNHSYESIIRSPPTLRAYIHQLMFDMNHLRHLPGHCLTIRGIKWVFSRKFIKKIEPIAVIIPTRVYHLLIWYHMKALFDCYWGLKVLILQWTPTIQYFTIQSRLIWTLYASGTLINPSPWLDYLSIKIRLHWLV